MSEQKKNIKMKFVKIGILILVGLDIVFACSPVYVKDLTFYKKNLINNIPFRIDGYYYNKNCYSNNDKSTAYFFYPDGFFISSYQYDNLSLTSMDIELDTTFNIRNYLREGVDAKGAFKIVNDSVKIQVFHCIYSCDIVKSNGKIINDTTLLFIKKKKYKSEFRYNQDPDYCDTFHFRKLNWKPDSTYQIGFEKELKKHKYKF